MLAPVGSGQLSAANPQKKDDARLSMDSNQVEQMIRKIKDEAVSDRSSGQGVDGAKSYHQSQAQANSALAMVPDESEKKKMLLVPPAEEEKKAENED